MAMIIAVPQPTHINRNANSPLKSPACLKCATIPRKIKESAKVPATVRLIRLLPQNNVQATAARVSGVWRKQFPQLFLPTLQKDDTHNKTVI